MYINRFDFSMIQNSHIVREPDYFYVDDLIGPTVSELNKKGYKTIGSCSGHPCNKDVVIENISEVMRSTGYVEREAITFVNKEKTIKVFISLVCDKYTFNGNIVNSLPQGFKFEVMPGAVMISYKFNEEESNMGYYERALLLLELNEKLYNWAISLQ